MWEISENLHPAFIQYLFMKVSEKHQIMTRSSILNKYSLPHTLERISESSLSISRGEKLWNDEIPHKIKFQLTRCVFIRQYKSYLLNQ